MERDTPDPDGLVREANKRQGGGDMRGEEWSEGALH